MTTAFGIIVQFFLTDAIDAEVAAYPKVFCGVFEDLKHAVVEQPFLLRDAGHSVILDPRQSVIISAYSDRSFAIFIDRSDDLIR